MKKLFLATLFVSAGIGLVTIEIIHADECAEKSAQKAALSWLALETVTPMRDKDGHWRVSGYFIK